MVSKKKKKKKKKIGKISHGIGEKRWLFSIGNGAEFRSLEMGRKSPVQCFSRLIKLNVCFLLLDLID